MTKSKKYPLKKQIIGNFVIFLISVLIAISPFILHVIVSAWDPRFSAPGSGLPITWLALFTFPFALIFLLISLLIFNIIYYKKNKVNKLKGYEGGED